MRHVALLSLILCGTVLAASSYHLELQSSPASVVPLLSRFGSIELHVYDGGVRAESMWLDSFSRNGQSTMTVINPIARMYTEVPIDEFPAFIAKITGLDRSAWATDTPILSAPVRGKVNGMNAQRFRLVYSPTDWVDIWTTNAIPENAQLRRIITAFTLHFAPGAAGPMGKIPGTPIYVEMNTDEHPKFTLLKLQSMHFTADDESEKLRVGKWYLRAPLLDAIWK